MIVLAAATVVLFIRHLNTQNKLHAGRNRSHNPA